ncbi:hypothetical protein EXU57_07280 [Segetibacter sp. 3557_3]|uniref:transglutaminase domain-containing protein n=1 Tax=Segetibacter sp. 3557_3 TaxID=2547429 RepID=UPI001058F52F|nr:transglutaminase domain-containing protein [Segetibacter sp. 3557_3]TDH27381.1 hypothetical protein EXU57_07280 [Segetibacter sp. 3557_3]
MKPLLSIFLFLFSTVLFSQEMAYNRLPVRYRPERQTSPAELAIQLTQPYHSELEKVRSIFNWITDNISYKLRPWNPRNLKKNIPVEDDDTSSVLKPLNERVAENVLRSSEALCDGYARLFATLCSYANIRAEVVTGYSRTNFSANASKFKSNHSWNAVRIDSVWHLLDVTWASGYVSYMGERFIRHQNDEYFLTPPKQFIAEHYPENLEWSFLTEPPLFKEFDHTPFKSQRFIKSRVKSFKPEKGTVDARVGDTLTFEIETTDIGTNLEGTYDPQFDSTISLLPPSWAYLKPQYVEGKPIIRYQYVVPSTEVQYLNIVLHDEVLMRYRLVAKPKPQPVLQDSIPQSVITPIIIAGDSRW